MKHVGVQHHHAHIASCMAENHLDGKVIGIALDGTGYGTDGAVWGGEVLLATYADFERAGASRLRRPCRAARRPSPNPGAWRSATCTNILAKLFGTWTFPLCASLDHRQAAVLARMADRGINSPLTSSCGRLFDAVSALAGIRQRVNYEAQAAIELEAAIVDGRGGRRLPVRPSSPKAAAGL